MLQETIAKMPKEEAAYYMKRCVDAGLWVPEAKQEDESTDATPNSIPAPATNLDVD